MTFPIRRPLVLALVAALPALACAAEGDGPRFTFSGFGTLAAVHSSEDKADFVGNTLQPNGVGYTRNPSTNPDSKLAGQLNAVFSDQFSAVLQVVSQYRYDASWTPQVEWLNVKYKPSSDLSLRVGRIAMPTYLMSESRLVGYAHVWARPPQEVYGVMPLTSNDGVDASWNSQIGSAQNTVQAYYGTNKIDVTGGGTAKAKPSWGINDTLELGSLTLRAAYSNLKEDIDIPMLQPLYDGMAALGETDMLAKYSPRDMKTSVVALGASYDPGQWFVMGEFVDYKGAGILSDSRSWYLAGGYRFGKFTPYVIYGRTKAKEEVETDGGFLNDGINMAVDQTRATQKNTTVGLRFDAFKNVAIKLQYDRLDIEKVARIKPHPGYVPGRMNLVTLSADFVF